MTVTPWTARDAVDHLFASGVNLLAEAENADPAYADMCADIEGSGDCVGFSFDEFASELTNRAEGLHQ